MAIRVFFNRWAEEASGGLLYIKDPIDEYLANVSLSAPVESINFHARIALNKRPDRVYLVKAMRGNLTTAEWDSLAAVPGVLMVPPGRFDDPVSSLKNPVKTKIYAALDNLGIPRSTFDSAASIGGFLRNVLLELNGADSGFGAWESDPAEWA